MLSDLLLFFLMAMAHTVTADHTTDLEAMLILGGGTPDNPEFTALLLEPNGRLCSPKEKADLPVGLYGPGVVRVEGGIVVCGGRQRRIEGDDSIVRAFNRKCWLWTEEERVYKEIAELEIDDLFPNEENSRFPDGSILMANDPRNKNVLYAFVQGSAQFFSGQYLPEFHQLRWNKRGVVNYTSLHPNETSLLRDSTCMVVYDGVVFLLGGRDFSLGALKGYGLHMYDREGETMEWKTMALDPPDLHSAACAVEYVDQDTKEAVVWLAGGITTVVEGGERQQKVLRTIRQGRLSPSIRGMIQWDSSASVEMKQDRANATFAVLDKGHGERAKFVLSCNLTGSASDCSGISLEEYYTDEEGNRKTRLKEINEVVNGMPIHTMKLLTRFGSTVVPLDYFPSCVDYSESSADSVQKSLSLFMFSMLLVTMFEAKF